LARKKPSPAKVRLKRARALDKKKPGFGSYTYRLSVVRQVTAAFDAKKFDTLKFAKPRTAKQKAARRRKLNNFNRTYHRLRLYLEKPHKIVKVKNKKQLDSLRSHLRIPKFKKMRGVPVLSSAKRVTVRFDKKLRPLIREDGIGQKLFLFPHMPRSHKRGKKFIDAEADAQRMLDAMLPDMPEGFYALATRHSFLISDVGDRESLKRDLAEFYNSYGRAPEFLKEIVGFKFLTNSIDAWQQWKDELKSQRAAVKGARKRQRLARALKEIIAMDKQLKSGKPLSRGQVSRRAKITGRR